VFEYNSCRLVKFLELNVSQLAHVVLTPGYFLVVELGHRLAKYQLHLIDHLLSHLAITTTLSEVFVFFFFPQRYESSEITLVLWVGKRVTLHVIFLILSFTYFQVTPSCLGCEHALLAHLVVAV
jgi:hypothetical protein